MESLRFHLNVEGGRFVTASWLLPEQPRAVLTLAHGAGTQLDHPLMRELAFALASEQLAVLRFNFPYSEQKRKRPDMAAQTFPVIEAAVREASNRFPKLPLFLAGKSFGGRMSSQWVATNRPGNVRGLIFFGFPLHPSGKPGIERATHLKEIVKPLLFIQGTNDELATLSLLQPVVGEIPNAELFLIEGANHSLQVGKMIDYTAIGSAVRRFVEKNR
jgi:predicted alpha/beta-hydrolase family hydrolase